MIGVPFIEHAHVIRTEATSVLGDNSVIIGPIPENETWYVIAAVVFHNDAVTDHFLQIRIQPGRAAGVSINSSQADLVTPIAANIGYPVRREFLVPGGCGISGIAVGALGVGSQVTLQIFALVSTQFPPVSKERAIPRS